MVYVVLKWDIKRKGVIFFFLEKMNLESVESEGKIFLVLVVILKLFEVVKMLVSVC